MKTAILKALVPMTLLTLTAFADQGSLPMNIPVDTKINEIDQNNYDNRLKFAFGYSDFRMGGVGYERLKTESAYFGISVAAFSKVAAIEALGGYNFQLSSQDRLTPIGGVSYFHDAGVCPLIGVLYDHKVNQSFRVGASFKSFFIADGAYSVGVPLTFCFGDHGRWELELQPYAVHLNTWLFRHTSTGLQGSLAYRF